MASSKLQKPTNETSSRSHEEHKIGQKISEMTAKVFRHKQQEQQEFAKHCTTCKCPAIQKGTKSVCMDPVKKKEHAATASVKDTKSEPYKETKKMDKEGLTSKAHKDAKHTNCIELKKKEKHQETIATTKESKQTALSEMRKNEKKDQHTKTQTTNADNTLNKKEHKDKQASHYFSSMTDHLKEKIMLMKTSKDEKSKYSSSDSEDDAYENKKLKNKGHSQVTKPASK